MHSEVFPLEPSPQNATNNSNHYLSYHCDCHYYYQTVTINTHQTLLLLVPPVLQSTVTIIITMNKNLILVFTTAIITRVFPSKTAMPLNGAERDHSGCDFREQCVCLIAHKEPLI